jgi:hypothetical protein
VRFTEKFWNGKWWPRQEWDAMVAAQRARVMAGRTHPAPMVIRDSMDDVLNPVNGQLYDSKRAYERDVRAAGCTIVGNESFNTVHTPPEVPGLEQDIKTAIDQLSAS